ncbi:MAG: BPL-N domain-containing protein [Bacteroidales bacterium]
MKKKLLIILLSILSISIYAQSNNVDGYYKDLFMDSGIKLTSKVDLPVTRLLGLNMEVYYSATGKKSSPFSITDTLLQSYIMIGNPNDWNGILLYPDGAPRFRMIYTNGGQSTCHGRSLGEEGRNRVREFIKNGGSYLGSCAGAYLTCKRISRDSARREFYYNVWPGVCVPTHLIHSHTGMFVPKKSPLLKYKKFGGDFHIDSVVHNGGCFASEDMEFPKGTKILLRYDNPENFKTTKGNIYNIHKKLSAWAYKPNAKSGRIVAIGSHPESVTYGERLDLMIAMVKYALDGNGNPKIKAILQPGETREMTASTVDNIPDSTRIGDRQYHHFLINVPKKVKEMKVVLEPIEGWEDSNLSLFANKDDFAFNNADYHDITLGVKKTLLIENPSKGEWYISIFCEDTVTTEKSDYGFRYVGDTKVLNGVPYKIKVELIY